MRLSHFISLCLTLLAGSCFAGPSDRITVNVQGQGPDVVLIPGATCSNAVWQPIVKQFAGKYRLHLIQVAGFAGAPAGGNAKGLVLQPTVEAIHDYIKANHLHAPKIIGHSIGGLMGMMLAVEHPEDMSKLMVVDSLPFFSVLLGAKDATSAKPMAEGMRDQILNETQEQYAEGEKQFLGSMVKSPEGFKKALSWALASDKSVVARSIYEDMITDMRPKLAQIKTPVTMLYPYDETSGFPQAAVDTLYKNNFASLPNKTMVRIDGSYHFIMFDQPEKFAEQVERFLKP